MPVPAAWPNPTRSWRRRSRSCGPRDLAGRRILVTAGGTREPLDPVRFIGNRSSGRQGVAIARAAAARGASVTLVAANLEVDAPGGIERAARRARRSSWPQPCEAAAPDADIVIMAAAVADYRPESVSAAKIKKDEHGDTARRCAS